jgi:hypothetical protein
VPLHNIPNYCFGTLIAMETVSIFIFFPQLHEESDNEHSTYFSNDEQLWYGILAPCVNKVIGSSGILQHYPASARIASLDSTAKSAESLSRKSTSREQLITFDFQPKYLGALWTLILETIEDNPGFHGFRGATLFLNVKNIKLQYMDNLA